MRPKKFVLSYSGGKDCVLALDRAIRQGHAPLGLLVTFCESEDCSWFHRIPMATLKHLETSLGIPMTLLKTDGEHYEQNFEAALENFKRQGAEAVVFGDIDIREHYDWCHARCENVGLESAFPLWGEDRRAVVDELIDRDFEAMITIVNTRKLNAKYLGKILTCETVSQIVVDGADACGENGEYHTLVVDGPLFKKPIRVSTQNIARNSDYAYIILEEENP